jgi:hypothetical protein
MKAVARVKDRLSRWREWELNPVVVKELRQAVRNWSVTGMLLVFLVVLFCTFLGYMINQTFTTQLNQRIGAQVFQALIVILSGASTLFIPLYVGVRLAIERQENNVDLLYISTLTPGRIIRGKFYCGAYMALLFFSACMPFMAFTNLLRGVDLPTVFFILLVLFLIVCGAIQIAILLACLPISKPLKVLVGLVGIGAAFGLLGGVIQFTWELMRSGVGAMMASRGFWIAFSTTLGIGVAAFLLLHFLSIALIAPVSANRALPLRVYLTVIWLLGGGLSVLWVRQVRDTRLLLPWAIGMSLLLIGALFIVVSSHDQLSLRVRRRIPRSVGKRVLAFLFFNGAAGGLVWVTLLLGVTFGATWFALHSSLDTTVGTTAGTTVGYHSMSAADLDESTTVASAVLFYLLAYSLTALFVQRRFFGRRPPRLAGVLALIIPGALAVIPNLALFFLNRLNWSSVERVQLGNVFNLFVVRDDAFRRDHLIFAAIWLVIALVLNARWFVRQVRSFEPLTRGAAAPPEPIATAPGRIRPA